MENDTTFHTATATNGNPWPETASPVGAAKKNPLRSFWDWTIQSWKRTVLVGVVALVVLGVIVGAASSGGGSSGGGSNSASSSSELPYCPVGFVPDTPNPTCVENRATQQDIQNQIDQAQAQNQSEQEQQQAQQQANNNSFEQGLGYAGSQ